MENPPVKSAPTAPADTAIGGAALPPKDDYTAADKLAELKMLSKIRGDYYGGREYDEED